MSGNFENGYLESIQRGLRGVRAFRSGLSYGRGDRAENIQKLRQALQEAEAVVIGAGAGLSTSAGFTYSGERFERYFFDFHRRFGIEDMYSGGFYPFPNEGTRWAWWARHIYYNRYVDPPRPVYRQLRTLLAGKDFFVITTNVDHQFQRAGFPKERLFYTQGDYGLFQSADRRIQRTFDNEGWVRKAMAAQGFVLDGNGVYQVPEDRKLSMRLPDELIPTCPVGGGPVVMNLRSDDSFVEDEGWQAASARYEAFLRASEKKRVLFLELGVGGNTPVIIKYPFWTMTAENPNATFACLNFSEALCPKAIESRSVCLDGDIGDILEEVL